ncbi:MAG: hypothetical protein ACLVKR_00825 [Lachnospiraceae bacterium]
MIENLDIFDFELTQEEMEKFRPLNTYNRTGKAQTNSLKQALLNEREERNFDKFSLISSENGIMRFGVILIICKILSNSFD